MSPPEPFPPPEVEGLDGAGTAGAFPAARPVVATCHLPITPSPFVCPADVSGLYSYSGCPLYTTCEALPLVATVSVPVTPDASVGPVAVGGQSAAQVPVQVGWPPALSGVK